MGKNEEKTLKNSKLSDMLEGISNEEYKKFGLFLSSPYFNKSRTMQQLYYIFKKYRVNNRTGSLTRKTIYNELYPGKRYNDVLLRKQLSDFTKLTGEFLIDVEAKIETAKTKNLLLSSLIKRNIQRPAGQALNELEKFYEFAQEKDNNYYYNRLQTGRLAFSYSGSGLHSPEEQISELSKRLDHYYLSLKLLFYYDILNLKLHYNKSIQFDMWGFDEIVKYIEKNKQEIESDHISIYADYLSVKMLLEPAENKHYEKLRSYIDKNKSRFVRQELEKFYVYLYNHSIYRLNRGFVKGNGELYDIIKTIDREDIPIWKFFAFHIFYINAVTNASRAGEYEWIESFVKRRKEYIPPAFREETHNLAMANLYFTKKEYSEAMKYLVNVDYPNYSYYLMAKDMLIKIYWERSEPEGVLSTIEAMRKFLQRKELIPQRLHESYTNFINCVSRMVEPEQKDSDYEIQKLLKKEMIYADKVWIEERLNDSRRKIKYR